MCEKHWCLLLTIACTDHDILTIKIELEALKKEKDEASIKRREILSKELNEKQREADEFMQYVCHR